MPAPELFARHAVRNEHEALAVPATLPGLRVVAAAGAIEALAVAGGGPVLRFAADEVFIVGESAIDVADPDAIIVPETGLTGWWLTLDQVRDSVVPHIEWPLPEARPVLAQGLVAGVPAKLWLDADRALLLCASAYAHELVERLG